MQASVRSPQDTPSWLGSDMQAEPRAVSLKAMLIKVLTKRRSKRSDQGDGTKELSLIRTAWSREASGIKVANDRYRLQGRVSVIEARLRKAPKKDDIAALKVWMLRGFASAIILATIIAAILVKPVF